MVGDPSDRDTGGPSPARDLDLEPGMVVADKFEILGVIGAGGMGTVYLAEHRSVGRKVAIKVLAHELSTNPAVKRRFRAEARAAAAIGHPNIVDVLDAAELPDGRPYMVLEHLQGRHLLQELQAEGPLPVERACRIVRDVARALAAAHEIGIVHRDLKAENVMLVRRPDGEIAKVLDFGIAAHIHDMGGRLTTPGMIIGTPEYMAPEQALGADPRPTFDIYALGVLLFELLTGEPPFSSPKPMELLRKKTKEVAPPLGDRRADVPAVIVELVRECLSIEPHDRPESATLVAERLDAFLQAPKAAPLPMSAPAPRAGRAIGPWVVAAGTAAVVAVVGVQLYEPDPEPATVPATVREVEQPRRTLAGEDADRERPLVVEPAPAAAVEPETPPPANKAPPPEPVARERKRDPPTPVAAPAKPADSESIERPSDTPECERMRQAAVQARESHTWDSVLRETERASCWPSKRERAKLRLKALMELGRFEECVAIGNGITVGNDKELQKWITTCELRVEAGE